MNRAVEKMCKTFILDSLVVAKLTKQNFSEFFFVHPLIRVKESSVSLKTKTNGKNDVLKNPLKFKCKMCDFQSNSSGGLKNHITRKHTYYSENYLPM